MEVQRIPEFQKTVYGYFEAHGRDLPWRQPEADGNFDAYKILVSEMMLQQTQVNRVIPKYQEFLTAFPDVRKLAEASLAEVLKHWSGLGYNRRAKFLHQAAQQIVDQHKGVVPKTLNTLTNLPGIGHNTAAAICVYAYNQPQVFIETNIRSVYIHHFFHDAAAVADADILPLVAASLHGQDPRSFYWALMDYGSHLKSTQGNAATRSKHYTKQSVFAGSVRQLRGQILRLLIARSYSMEELLTATGDDRLPEVITALEQEGLVTATDTGYRLP